MPFEFEIDKRMKIEEKNEAQFRARQVQRVRELQKSTYSTYNKAFVKGSPSFETVCSALKTEKNRACHLEYPRDCELRDSDDVLNEKKKQKEYCLDLRFLELESDCFPKTKNSIREGHEQFKKVEEQRYNKCAEYVLIPRGERIRLDEEKERKERERREREERQQRQREQQRARERERERDRPRKSAIQPAPASTPVERKKVYVLRK